MKVGIIVFSQTGNTLSVAEKVKEALLAAGHDTALARIEVSGEGFEAKIVFAPDVNPYDAVIFASPVQAFSLAMVMKKYLAGISSLSGKKVYSFVTQGLKKSWMGGSRAVRQIASACKVKGADVIWSGIIHWTPEQKDGQICEIVSKFGAI